MRLKPTKHHIPKILDKNIAAIMSSPGKFLTEEQLADILGLNIKQAVIKAAELKLSRIHVKYTRYYSKKQVQAYLDRSIRHFPVKG